MTTARPLAARPGGAERHSWLSNPLDWPHIDRMVLLAGLVMICPVALSLWLAGVALMAPDWVNPPVVKALFGLFALHALLLGSFLLAAGACVFAARAVRADLARTRAAAG